MEIEKNLEFEYTPSKSSKRFQNPTDVIKNHIRIVTQESALVRQKIPHSLDIKYGENDRESFDLYHNDLSADAPIFVFIHGGYWQDPIFKDASAYCVRPLVKIGYKVVIVDYNLCPHVTLAEITKQIIKFGKFILNYAQNIGSRYVSVAGHSAGAHLATFFLTDNFLHECNSSNLLKNFYLISGVYDLKELRQTSCVNQGNLLSLDSENAIQLSPMFFDFTKLKTFHISIDILVAENDSETFKIQSKHFYEKLLNDIKDMHRVKYHCIKDVDHFNVVENLSDSSFCVTKLFESGFHVKL